jgi:hypothetical protein
MCPNCGGPVHRSRTRGFGEKVVKTLTVNRTYRCFECEWRGWLQATDISQLRESRRRRLVRTIISVLVAILATALFALYMVRKTHADALTELRDKDSQRSALVHREAEVLRPRSASSSTLTLIHTSVFCNNGCPRRFLES